MTAQTATSIEARTSGRRRKIVLLAVLLQCIPLLGAAACFSFGVNDQHLNDQQGGAEAWLWFSVLFWGFGYLYLARWRRFWSVFLVGPVFAFSSCTASFSGVTYDWERPWYSCHYGEKTNCAALQSANRASIQEGLIIAAAVLLLAVDAWRLAAAHNATAETGRGRERRRRPRYPPGGPRGILPGTKNAPTTDRRASSHDA